MSTTKKVKNGSSSTKNQNNYGKKKNVMERPNSRLEVTKRVTELKKKQLKSPNLSIRKITLKK